MNKMTPIHNSNFQLKYNEVSDSKSDWFSPPRPGPDGDYPYRGLTPVRVTQLPNVPCPLQLHKRSPQQILEKKSQNVCFIKASSSSGNSQTTPEEDLTLIEEEIRMKLFYLEKVIEIMLLLKNSQLHL